MAWQRHTQTGRTNAHIYTQHAYTHKHTPPHEQSHRHVPAHTVYTGLRSDVRGSHPHPFLIVMWKCISFIKYQTIILYFVVASGDCFSHKGAVQSEALRTNPFSLIYRNVYRLFVWFGMKTCQETVRYFLNHCCPLACLSDTADIQWGRKQGQICLVVCGDLDFQVSELFAILAIAYDDVVHNKALPRSRKTMCKCSTCVEVNRVVPFYSSTKLSRDFCNNILTLSKSSG